MATAADDIFRPYQATVASEPYYTGRGGHRIGYEAEDGLAINDTITVLTPPDDDGDVWVRRGTEEFSLNLACLKPVPAGPAEPGAKPGPLSIDMIPDTLRDTRTVKVSTMTQVLIDCNAFSPFAAESLVATALVRESLDKSDI